MTDNTAEENELEELDSQEIQDEVDLAILLDQDEDYIPSEEEDGFQPFTDQEVVLNALIAVNDADCLREIIRISNELPADRWQEISQDEEVKDSAIGRIERLLLGPYIDSLDGANELKPQELSDIVRSYWSNQWQVRVDDALRISELFGLSGDPDLRKALESSLIVVLLHSDQSEIERLKKRFELPDNSLALPHARQAAAGRLYYELESLGGFQLTPEKVDMISWLVEIIGPSNPILRSPEFVACGKEALSILVTCAQGSHKNPGLRRILKDLILRTIFKSDEREAYRHILLRSLHNVNLTAQERAENLEGLQIPNEEKESEQVQAKVADLMVLELTPKIDKPHFDEVLTLKNTYNVSSKTMRRVIAASVFSNINTFRWGNALAVVLKRFSLL